MSTYCVCTTDVIAKSGFTMRNSIASCNNCGKQEVSSQPSGAIKKGSQETTFFQDLFEYDFERFISVTYFKVLYKVSVILLAISWSIIFLLVLINGESLGGGVVFLAMVLIPIVFLISVLYTRLNIELIVNFFQIGRDIKGIRDSR